MVKTEYSMLQAFGHYANFILEDKTFIVFALAALVFVILVALNRNNKGVSFLFLGLNLLLTIIILFTFGFDILDNFDTFFHLDLYKNMYFFFLNSVIALCTCSWIYKSKRCDDTFKNIMLVIYFPLITNIIYMLSISNYFQDSELILLFNSYPMVYVGNLIYFTLYVFLFLYWFFAMKKKKKRRLGNHL